MGSSFVFNLLSMKRSSHHGHPIHHQGFWIPFSILAAGFLVAGAVLVGTHRLISFNPVAVQPPGAPGAPADVPTAVVPVSDDNDPSFGKKNAKVTIIEFSDFQCPFCKRSRATLDQIKKAYPNDVRIVYRDFPLGFHPKAPKAAEAAECANVQGKFWEMHDLIYAGAPDKLEVSDFKGYAKDLKLSSSKYDECLDSGKFAAEVKKDFEDGQKAGVSGTPTFFINGRKLVGAQPFESFKKVIDEELGKK